MPLTKDQIVSLNTNPTKEVRIEEWNDTVFIRTITGKERNELEQLLRQAGKDDEPLDSLEHVVSIGLADQEGNRLFEANEVHLLSDKPLAVLKKIFFEILDHNKLLEDSIEDLKGN